MRKILVLILLASCSAARVPVEEPIEWDTVYQAKQGCVWTQVNDSTWVKDSIP